MFRAGLFSLAECSRKFLTPSFNVEVEQIRTTFILKRRWAPGLHKKDRPPRVLKGKHFVYDLVENTETKKQENLQLVLTSYVEGLGLKGDIVSVRRQYGREQLLLPGLAVYASPENIEKYQSFKDGTSKEQEQQYSSRFSQMTVKELSRLVLNLLMNKDNPWTLEKFHVRSAFRRAGYWVPDHALQLPEKPVSGPDLSLENKDILVRVTINNLESTYVRCRIHHWSTELKNRLPFRPVYWLEPSVPVFEEDKDIIETLPPPVDVSKKVLAKLR